jgi:hypothetical protein
MADNFEQEKKNLLRELVFYRDGNSNWNMHSPTVLQKYSYEIRSNKELVLTAITFNTNELKHASDNLRKDKDVVRAAINISSNALYHSELKKDKEFIFDILQPNEAYFIKYIHEDLKKDEEFVLTLFNKNKNILQHISEELLNNEEFLYSINEICKLDSKEFENFYSISPRIQNEIRENPDYLLDFASSVNYKPAKSKN